MKVKHFSKKWDMVWLTVNTMCLNGLTASKVRWVSKRLAKRLRFRQPADGSKPIIPNILRKLLKARKSTRKLIVFQTVTLDDGSELSGLYSCKEVDGVETVTIVDKDGQSHEVPKSRVVSQKSTYSEFEQAVFDGLQLAYKLTAKFAMVRLGLRQALST